MSSEANIWTVREELRRKREKGFSLNRGKQKVKLRKYRLTFIIRTEFRN